MARTAPLKPEHRWPPIVGTACAAVLYVLLPNDFSLLPSWITPTLSVLLLIPLVVLNPHHLTRDTWWSRGIGLALAVVLFSANQVAIVRTVQELLNGHAHAPAVLLASLQVWLTDVIVFGLIYWELDRGGSVARRMRHDPDKVWDFRFPQEDSGPTPWRPAYIDYLYFSLSTMMAFSPTDVMPLSGRAKALMGVQAFTGFVLLALVISRAVNILG